MKNKKKKKKQHAILGKERDAADSVVIKPQPVGIFPEVGGGHYRGSAP